MVVFFQVEKSPKEDVIKGKIEHSVANSPFLKLKDSSK
jgi:hypothetical protein